MLKKYWLCRERNYTFLPTSTTSFFPPPVFLTDILSQILGKERRGFYFSTTCTYLIFPSFSANSKCPKTEYGGQAPPLVFLAGSRFPVKNIDTLRYWIAAPGSVTKLQYAPGLEFGGFAASLDLATSKANISFRLPDLATLQCNLLLFISW